MNVGDPFESVHPIDGTWIKGTVTSIARENTFGFKVDVSVTEGNMQIFDGQVIQNHDGKNIYYCTLRDDR